MQNFQYNDIVDVYVFPNFETFLGTFGDNSKIKSIPDISRYTGKSGVIFRGQADSEWDLIPKIMRAKDLQNVDDLIINYPNSQNFGVSGYIKSEMQNKSEFKNHDNLLMTEFQILRNFYNSCSYNGLQIESIYEFDSRITNFVVVETVFSSMYAKYGTKNWYITEKHESLAALAQHYGIPTRLMDFTYDLYTALYFATKDAVKQSLSDGKIDSNKKISIWTMYPHGPSTELFFYNGLKIIQPIYANNPNLNAQKGLLVYWNLNTTDALICEPSITNITKNIQPNDRVNKELFIKGRKDIFKRFDLSYNELPKIWSFLLQKGCSATKYFPGYHSIIEEMNEWKILNDINMLVGK